MTPGLPKEHILLPASWNELIEMESVQLNVETFVRTTGKMFLKELQLVKMS